MTPDEVSEEERDAVSDGRKELLISSYSEVCTTSNFFKCCSLAAIDMTVVLEEVVKAWVEESEEVLVGRKSAYFRTIICSAAVLSDGY